MVDQTGVLRAQEMTFIRTEPAPPNSLLKGETVVYRDADWKLWRVAAATWKAMERTQQQVRVLKAISRKKERKSA